MFESDSESEGKEDEVQENRNESSESSYEEEEMPVVVPKEGSTLVELISGENLDKMTSPQPQPRRKRFIPKYEVEGVYRVTLGEETQITIEMMIGTHINAQYPWKSISKEKILEHIDVYGELSEFYPIKEPIESYEDEMILMGYIVDESSDTDEFYICCTKDARDHCKQQSDKYIRRQEKKLEKAVQKKPRPWKSLGSEVEITELIPINSRSLLEIEIKSKFPTEYQPEKFLIRDTNSVRDGFIELTPYRQKYNLVFRRRIDCGSQIAPPLIEREAQTVPKYPKNMWTQSIADALGKMDDAEGGGDAGRAGNQGDGEKIEGVGSSDEDDDDDKSIQAPDEVGMAAYKAALHRLRRPSYIKKFNNFMHSKRDEIDSIVELNTVMDIYCNDYPNLVAEKSSDVYDSMAFEEYVCFTDVRAKDKYVSAAVFHPMWTGIVAISYADGSPSVMKTLSTRPDPIQRAVYGLNPVMIWSHIDSLIPKLYLEAPREVKCLSFCPFDENLLVGGCLNGQIVIWDLTHKLENVETIEVLSETRERYKIAMQSHMTWMKNVHDDAVVPATVLSNLVTSHYGPVTSIKWLSPNFIVTPTGKVMLLEKKKSIMFLSGSEDGIILIWNLSLENVSAAFEGKKVKKSKRVPRRPSGLTTDVSPLKILDRNLQPCFKIILGVAGQPHVLPLQCFDMDSPLIKYTYTPRNTGTGRKYFSCDIIKQTEDQMTKNVYCGSTHGEIMKITWEGHEFNTGEVVNSEYCEISYRCHIHDGGITATKQNPFVSSLTLTIGGKIFAIWSDKFKDRPLIWKKRPFRLTDAAWSLYKASLVFVATAEGTLETWDLLLRSDQPIAVQALSGSTLTGVYLHTLPLPKNLIGVSDTNGSFKMFLDPPIFMIENPRYALRLENMIERELNVMKSFIQWQHEWMTNNPHVLLEIKRKEGALLLEKEEEKRRLREEEEKRLEEEAEARRIAKLRVIGPEERWQKIIQKLIERTIAVKKRINRAELIEHEKPLRELEAQRLEKERRMLEIMKNQKTIFKDTVAILFPEAIKKPPKPHKSLLAGDMETMKKEFLEDFEYLKKNAINQVIQNPYMVAFSWDATLAEGKERRQALNANEDYIKMHKYRLDEGLDLPTVTAGPSLPKQVITVPIVESEFIEEVE